jgi:hypothetical protein
MKVPDWFRLSDKRGRERVLYFIISTFAIAILAFPVSRILETMGVVSVDVGLVGWIVTEFGGNQAVLVFIVGLVVAYFAGFIERMTNFFRTGRFVEHGVLVSLAGLLTMGLAAAGMLPVVNWVVWVVAGGMAVGGFLLSENQKERREAAR